MLSDALVLSSQDHLSSPEQSVEPITVCSLPLLLTSCRGPLSISCFISLRSLENSLWSAWTSTPHLYKTLSDPMLFPLSACLHLSVSLDRKWVPFIDCFLPSPSSFPLPE